MRASMIVPGVLLGTALASAANAQTVIERTITQEPVETTVAQTPAGTIVTRRPLDVAGETVVPNTVDAITTREVVRRAETRRPAPRARQTVTHSVSARLPAKKLTSTVPRRATTQRLALSPAERHVVYQTIVEREVVPAPRVVSPTPYAVPPAPYVAPQPPLISAQVGLPAAPVVGQEEVVTPTYAVGSVLPASVPLYAVPQDVALRAPAIQRYSYGYVGGRAYLVDPATGVIVEDVTEE
jgi:Protein of unknown function (DUF1236)